MPNIDELSVKFSAKGINPIVNNILKLADAVESLASKSRELDSSKISGLATALGELKGKVPTKGQVTNLKELAVAVAALNTAAGSGDITTFANGINTVSAALGNLKGTPKKQIDNITSSLQKAGQQAQKTASQMNGVAPKTKGQTPKTPTPKTPPISSVALAKQFAESNKEIEKSTINISKMKQSLLGIKALVPTNKMKQLQESTEKARQRYNDLRESIRKAIEAGDLKPSSKGFVAKQKELDGLRQKYDDLILKQKQLAQEGGAVKINPNFGKAFDGIKQSVGGVKQAFSGIGNVVKTANGYINSFISKIKSLGAASKKTKKESSSLGDTIKKLSNEFFRLSKMLKLMITRMALRAVIKELGNGFKSLALHSQEFDDAMSNIINSSKTLGYSISGMLSPLIMALAQPLLYIIQLLTRAINLINQLFSALSGASTWNKAKDFTGKWSDSIKEANGQAKELKKTVLGFDELNQLQDKKTGGKSGANITDMFETVDIDSKIKDWAKKIKDVAKQLFDPIKKAWDKVGTYVKNSWKYAMDEVLKLGKKVGKDFLKVWSQKETERIFENILVTIGLIGRTIGNLARQFRKAWSENDTGLHILEHIRNIILIITEHIKNMARATADWAGKLDFTPLLTSVEKWLASLEPVFDAIMGVLEDFYKEVVLKFTKWVVESGLPALIDVFKRFNDEVHWDELREKLNTLWKHLEPFMETVGEGLIIFIDRVSQALADFINGEKFEDFLQFLEDWMDSVTPEDVADGIEKLVKAIAGLKIAGLVLGALSTLGTILGTLVTVGKGIASIVGGITSFAGAIAGLGTAGLITALAIGAVLIALYSFVESYGGAEEAFAKLRDVAKEVGDNIAETARQVGLIPSEYNNSASSIENLTGAFGELKDALGDAKGLWDGFFAVLVYVANAISTAVIPIIKDLTDFLAALARVCADTVNVVSGSLDMLIGTVTGDWDRAHSGAEKVAGNIGKLFTDMFTQMQSASDTKKDVVNAPFAYAEKELFGGGLLDKILGAYTEVGKETDNLREKSSSHHDAFKNLSDDASNFGSALSNLKDVQSDTASTFKTHADIMREQNSKYSDYTETLKKHSDSLQGVKKKNEEVVGQYKTHWDVINQNKDATDKYNTSLSTSDESMKKYIEQIGKYTDALVNIMTSEQDVNGATETFNDTLKSAQEVMKDTSDTASDTGKNIVDGIKEPMTTASFDEEAKTLFAIVFGAYEKSFEIGSPAKKMKPIGENIVLGVNEGMTETFDTFTKTMTDFYDNHVKTWFDKDKWSFDGVGEGLKKTFEGAKNAIKGVWNGIADKLNGEHEIGESKIKINLPKFATGGFPSENGIFMANSSELVGRFNNGRTAVANNAMIVEGIERGVYSAVSSAMANSSGGSQYISNEIIVDGEVVARSITKAQEKMNRRYSPQTV